MIKQERILLKNILRLTLISMKNVEKCRKNDKKVY